MLRIVTAVLVVGLPPGAANKIGIDAADQAIGSYAGAEYCNGNVGLALHHRAQPRRT